MAVRKKGKLSAGPAADRDRGLLYSANQIWLAGLGAMSRAQSGAPKLFEELAEEGSKLQGSALDTAQKVVRQAFEGAQKSVGTRVDTVRGQANDTWDNLEKIFQARVQRAMHRLGMPSAEEITALARKVDELNASVEKLATRKAAPKKAAKKQPARRKAKSTRRKTAKAG